MDTIANKVAPLQVANFFCSCKKSEVIALLQISFCLWVSKVGLPLSHSLSLFLSLFFPLCLSLSHTHTHIFLLLRKIFLFCLIACQNISNYIGPLNNLHHFSSTSENSMALLSLGQSRGAINLHLFSV